MTQPAFQLRVTKGPQPGEIHPLSGLSITLGRDPLADVTLNDPEVSRQHARLLLMPTGGYQIQDLGSTNGTFIAGERLGGEPVALEPGQILVLGSTVELVYEAAGDEPTAAQVEDVRAPETVIDFPVPEAPETDEPVVEEVLEETAVAEPVAFEEPAPTDEATTSVEEIIEFEPPEPESAAAVEAEAEERPSIVEPAAPLPQWLEEEAPEPAEEPAPEPVTEVGRGRIITESGAPVTPPKARNGRRTTLIISGVILLLLCCCCSLMLFMWYVGGDWLLRQLGILP